MLIDEHTFVEETFFQFYLYIQLEGTFKQQPSRKIL